MYLLNTYLDYMREFYEMIFEQELIETRKLISKKINNVYCYGHIGKDCFNAEEIQQLRTHYNLLVNEKHKFFDVDMDDKEMGVSLGLWGEDTDLMDDDLGVACIFINEEPYIIPQHFMKGEDLAVFITTMVTKYHPEVLI